MNAQNSVLIYDTTLRDGTQGEGINFPVATKLRVAEKLDQFKIDYIEGGWPGSNPRDMAFFDEVRKLRLKHAKVAAFGSTRRADKRAEEDPQLQLLLEAETRVVTIFGKSWLLHVEEVLRVSPDENLRMIEDSVRLLRAAGREVIYDAEHFFDGYKNNADYAMKTLEAAVAGGAQNVSLCDTNGGSLVGEVGAITAEVLRRLAGVPVGVHCHNDSGLGVAVSLAGVDAGASLVQGTMNGYGERNGNANLTTIIPNLSLKMAREVACAGHLSKLRDLSLFIDEMANVRVDIRAPFVGASSFAHKGGVHADAAAKVKHSYEHIEPELVGNRTRVLVSDMSGRASLMIKARELGYQIDPKSPEAKDFLEQLKQLEFRGYEFEAADASFKLLLARLLQGRKRRFETLGYRVSVRRQSEADNVGAEATVKLSIQDEEYHTVAEAAGPIDALDHALRKALETNFPQIQTVSLVDYKVRILDSGQGGTDAIIRVHVESADGHQTWGTVGASDNIIDASWQALRDSMEYKILLDEEGEAAPNA
ncbi:MAG: citramalate synthase [Verrucomicrobiota bacterium]